MQLSFGQVEQLLRHLHGVSDRRRTMLRSRLQHLQKEDLPPGVAIGRGTRFVYGVDATFMIVVALELARTRMPAGHAARIVKKNWPTLRGLVDEGIAAAATPKDGFGRQATRWAVVSADGLSLLRRGEPGEDADVETVGDTPGIAIASWAQRLTAAPDTTIVLIDVVGRVAQAIDFIKDNLGIDPS